MDKIISPRVAPPTGKDTKALLPMTSIDGEASFSIGPGLQFGSGGFMSEARLRVIIFTYSSPRKVFNDLYRKDG